jgi:3-oxoacyl-[acyl-carrier-protein] synthase II
MVGTNVVITGLGVVSPIGIGRDAFWAALCQGKSGIRRIESFDASALPIGIAAEVEQFVPTAYVTKRKSLKLMCRDAQFGVAAAMMAAEDAGVDSTTVDPERLGVVLGADRICSPIDDCEATYRACLVDGRFDFNLWATRGMAEAYPLGFLRVLPNMIASHVSIMQDARGPNNTIHEAEVSGLTAVTEAARVIQRGAADVMIAGGASSEMSPFDCVRRCAMGILSRRQDDPTAAMRPFDADRDGQVWGEGAATFILESRRHAEARGAPILATVLSWASACEGRRSNGAFEGAALRRAIATALERAHLRERQLGHINAHGVSTVDDDQLEARAIRDAAPSVPVVAPKSYFGNLGAAGGAMEMAASVLAVNRGMVPPTLNYERPDPNCPVQVIHREALSTAASSGLLLNWTSVGQAATVIVGGPD